MSSPSRYQRQVNVPAPYAQVDHADAVHVNVLLITVAVLRSVNIKYEGKKKLEERLAMGHVQQIAAIFVFAVMNVVCEAVHFQVVANPYNHFLYIIDTSHVSVEYSDVVEARRG